MALHHPIPDSRVLDYLSSSTHKADLKRAMILDWDSWLGVVASAAENGVINIRVMIVEGRGFW